MEFTARTTEDLLAIVPCLLGFHPERSLVMLTFGAAGQAFQARLDLPETPAEVDAAVDLLVEPATRHRVGRVVLIAYGPDDDLVREVLHRLDDTLRAEGVDVVEVLRVEGDRWYGVRPGLRARTAGGVLFDVAGHEFLARTVFEGKVTHASREELADSLVGTDSVAIEAVESAVVAHVERWAEVQVAAEARWARDLVHSHVEAGTVPGTDEIARLLVAVQHLLLRDLLWGPIQRPDAAGHAELWREVLLRTPPDLVAAPASILAFHAWHSGQGALAWCAVDRAVMCDPDYSMAAVVADLLTSAMHPGTWSPMSAEQVLAIS